MATVDEVLATMEAEPVAPASEAEAFCTVNDNRQIIIPDTIKTIGVESDKDVEKIWFDVPATYDGSNLLEFSFYVNYANANKEENVYEVQDVTETDGRLRFYWLVSRNVVAYKGDVKFIVCAKKTDASGAVLQEWNTTIATLKVLEGLETSSAPIEENVDILEQWKADLFGLSESGKKTIEDVSAEKLAAINAAGDTATTNINAGIRQIELSAQQGLTDVNGAGTTQVQAVNTAGATQVDNINTAGSVQKAAVETAGTTQTANVNTAGAAQTAAVTQEGADQIAGIQAEAESYVKREDANRLAFKGKSEGRSHHVEDSADWGFLGMQGFGESEQVQTTGAQLFDASKITKESYLSDTSGQVVSGGPTAAGMNASDYIPIAGYDYVTVTTSMAEKRWGAFYNADKSFLRGIAGYGTLAVPEGAHYMRLTIADDALDTCMINVGEAALPWEPYTGGAPSPSTDYPQEIVSKCQARQLLNDDNFYDLMLVDKTPVFSNPRILNATDKYGTIKTTIDTPGTYTLSCDSNYYFMANRQYLNGEPVISIGRKLPYTFEVATPGTIAISVERDKSATDTTDIPIGEGKIPSDFRFMINAGKEPGVWAPYGKYGLETVVEGENLCNPQALQDAGFVLQEDGSYFIDKANKPYLKDLWRNTGITGQLYISYDTKHVLYNGKAGIAIYVLYKDGSQESAGTPSSESWMHTDFVTRQEKEVESIYFAYATSSASSYLQNVMISTAQSDYIPYTAQTLHTYLDMPLRGIPVSSGGNATIDGQQYIADYRDWERGKHIQRVRELVLDGSESYTLQSINDNGIANFVYTLPAEGAVIRGVLKNLCNMFRWDSNGIANVSEECYFNDATKVYFRIKSSTASTVEEFKAFVAQNNIQLQYVLATPIETDIPSEELAAYRRLHAYHGTTNIHNSDDVYTAVEYARDPDIYINNRLADISTAILNQNGGQ